MQTAFAATPERTEGGDSLVVRRASADAVRTIAKFTALLAMHVEKVSLNDEEVTRGVKAVFERPGVRSCYYLAWLGTNPVGQVLAARLWNDIANGDDLILRRLYVCEGWRERGVARRLIDAAVQDQLQCGPVVGVRADVHPHNLPSLHLFERLGFRPVTTQYYLRAEGTHPRAMAAATRTCDNTTPSEEGLPGHGSRGVLWQEDLPAEAELH